MAMDEIKYIIKAMVTSYAGRALTVAQLNKDYKEHEGQYIPYKMLGFQGLDQMLSKMSDAVQLRGRGDNALVLPVGSGKSQHIRNMIVQQKSSGRKPSKNNARNRSTAYRSTYNKAYINPRPVYPPAMDDSSTSSEEMYREEPINRSPTNLEAYPWPVYPPPMDDSCTSSEEMYREEPINRSPIDLEECTDNEYSDGQIVERVITDPEEDPSTPIPSATPMTLADKFSEPEVPSTLVPESIQRARVIKVHSPNEIHVQLMCHLEMLAQVADDLELMYGELDVDSEWQLDLESAKVGLYCIAKYEKFWYRVAIAGPVIDAFVEVFLIDYEHKCKVAIRDVKRMRKQDSLLPPQYVRVSLANVKPLDEKWTDKAIHYLENALYKKELYMFYKDSTDKNILNVVLIDATVLSDNIINKEIVFKKLAKWECAY
ncbi:RING finger protein 17-like isoform X1 [Anopheles coustani]|uniref:RING finger protein 17-like isoform X1 n=1 Tax=Anopheles coustani TaxID=139045 RepID=UPI00265AE082|nr:RING finger protein 17-like isoform X1 [Anopheles coustani]